MSRKLECRLLYQMGIQIYDQISIARKLSKVKLRRAFSLEFGLNQVEITRNIAKFGVHACISNGYPNLRSNFNFANLVKSEIPSCGFPKVWLKGDENNSEHRESLRAHLSSKCASKDMIKFQFREFCKR